MRKMRTLGLILAALMVCTMLAACAPSAGESSAAPEQSADVQSSAAPEEASVQTDEQPAQTQPEQENDVPAPAEQPADLPAHPADGEFYALSETLAALLDVYVATGEYYPADAPVKSDYAADYLYMLANQFYYQDARSSAFEDGAFDDYVVWDETYVDGLLRRAFGPAFTADQLEATDAVRIVDGMYYVGMGDPPAVKVTYVGDGNADIDSTEAYPFEYVCVYEDGETVSGELMAYLDRDSAGFAHVYAFDTDGGLIR